MLRHSIRALLLGLVVSLGPGILLGQDEAQLALVKQATVYLETPESSGTAFCISKKGYFLTCAHVLEGVEQGGEVSMSLRPGLPEEKTVKATVMRIEHGLDLALLQGPAEAVPALPLGDSRTLRETDSIVVAGFPLGRFLSTGESAPAVTVNSGKVTSLRRAGKLLESVQVDAELIPGNSGGPVLDRNGKVVGVAVATIFGTELNFAIASDQVELLLRSPRFEHETPETIPFASRQEPIELGVTLHYLRPPASPPEVKAWFVGASSGERPIEVVAAKSGAYTLKGTPVKTDALGAGSLLRAEFIMESGTVRHTQAMQVVDSTIKVDGKEVRLSEISLILTARGVVRKHDGSELEGTIEGLDSFKRYYSGSVSPMNGSNYAAISLRPSTVRQEKITCRVEVKGEGYTSNLRFPIPIEEGTVRVASFGDPAIPSFDPAATGGEPFAGERRDVKLRGEVYDVSWGGGGRYLVAHLRNERLLEVVDCLKGEVIGTIPLEGESVVFGAGAHELLVATGRGVARWTLDPLEKADDARPWVSGEVLRMSIGSGATQVVGLLSDALPGAGLLRFELREMRTGRLIAIEPMSSNLNKEHHFRASRDGYVHGSFSSQYHNASGSLFYPAGRVMNRDQLTLGALLPGVDGALYYTSMGVAGLRGYPGSRLASWEGWSVLPTTVRGLACRLPHPPGRRQSAGRKAPFLDLVDVRAGRVLLPGWVSLDELDPANMVVQREFTDSDPLTWDKRCFYSPQLGLLATLPLTNRSVVIRKQDLWTALREAGEEFLYVTGALPAHLKAGTTLGVTLATECSAAQPPVFELVEGPDGLVVSESGELSWEVPASAAGSMHRLLLRIRAGNGAERLWSHELAVH